MKKKIIIIAVMLNMIFGFVLCSHAQTTHNWTGFYISPNAGFSFNKFSMGQNSGAGLFTNITGVFVPGRGIVIVPGATRPVYMNSVNSTSFTGGIQGGYLKQFKKWVLGLEGDVNFLSAKSSQDQDDSLPSTALEWRHAYGYHHTATIQLTESILAKFGWANNNSLIYLTAGATFANVKGTANDYDNTNTYWAIPWPDGMAHPTPALDRFIVSTNKQATSFSITGLTIGAGYEWDFSPTTTLGIEYRYSNPTGTFNINSTRADTTAIDARPTYTGTFSPGPQKIKLTSSAVTVRLNFNLSTLFNPDSRPRGKKK